MPPVIAPIVGAVATAAATSLGASAIVASVVGTIATAVATVAVGALTKKKVKKRSTPKVTLNPTASASFVSTATATSSGASIGAPGTGGSPTPANLSVALATPNSLPPIRHVYGRVKAQGSPAPWRVSETYLLGCLILNSRPSEVGTFDDGSLEIRIDGETIEWTGDPFDFTDPMGAYPASGVLLTAAGVPYIRLWIGKGDQTGPPEFLTEFYGDIFSETDAWTGCTVVWMRVQSGPSDTFRERWAASPPEFEFTFKGSKVWDPRDEDQDPDDPDTWTYSNNQGLIALDAELQNPKEPLQRDLVDIEAYKAQADIADELVTTSAGDEPRYACNGIVVFNSGELHAILEPIYVAGASYRIRNGGLRSIAPGEFQEPEITITDYVGPDITIETLAPSRELVTRLRTSFANELVGFEEAELEEYEVPGATAADGNLPTVGQLSLTMVTSPYQAMRLTKVYAYEQRRQKTVAMIGFPETFELLNGSPVTVDIPGFEFADGTYRVETIRPLILPEGEDGVSLRCELQLVEWVAAAYAFSQVEEFTVTQGDGIDTPKASVAAPASLGFASGSDQNINTGGGVIIPRLLVTFPPSATSSVNEYEIETRINGSGDAYEIAGRASSDQTDGSGDVFFYIDPVTVGESYDVRVRAVSPQFGKSQPVEELNVTVAAPTATVSAPTGASINVTGATTLTYSAKAPNDADFDAMEVYINTSNDSGTATLAGGPQYGAPSQVLSFDITGLTASTTYYLWSRALDGFGGNSAFSAVASDTTDP